MMKPFLLVVTDRDRNEFTVEGPMIDDRPWIDAVVVAQNAGREVNCHTPGAGTKEDIAQQVKTSLGLQLVCPGSIVTPNSN